MNLNLVDLIRKLVRERVDELVGVVTNLHGAVAGESPPLAGSARQDWLWTRVPGNALVSLDEFLSVFATASGIETEIVSGKFGTTRIEGTQKLHFLRGTLIVPTSSMVPMSVMVSGAGAEVAVYVDGVLQRRSVNQIQLSLYLDQGPHFIEILAFSDVAVVRVPAHLTITANLEHLTAPQWIDIRTGYLDPAMAVAANTLEWVNDARAGGWRVLRRNTEILGPLAALGPVTNRGEFPIVISGDWAGFLEVGEELTAGPNTLGTVIGATYDAALDETNARLRLPFDQLPASTDWIGRPVGSGRFDELTRIRRGSTLGTVRHIDQNVRIGTIYEYKLQSFGLIDETQTSPFSDIEYIRAGDIDPPGPIIFRRFYPRLEGRKISCRFLTPSDEDYAGVRTYFRGAPITGVVTAATLTSVTDSSQNWAVDQFANYQLRVLSGGILNDDLFAVVVSSDATTVYTSGGMPVVASGGLDFELFYDRPVVTDYGLPNSEDQFSFDALRTAAGDLELGTYIFRTFDFSGNEQLGSGEQLWEFSGTTSPRTLVHFEDRDAAGDISTTKVTAHFTVTPEIQLVESGTITWVSGDQVEDSQKSWASGDYFVGETNHHFLWVYPTSPPGIFAPKRGGVPLVYVRRIVASEAPYRLFLDQALLTSGTFPAASGDRYEIYDGATFAHIGLQRAASLQALLPIHGPQFLVRAEPGLYVEFYSVVDTFAPEELQTTFLDNDEMATIGSLQLTEPLPNILMVKIDQLDDDVRFWRAYAKKALTDSYSGGWPTINGLIDGTLDEAYLRWSESIDAGKSYQHNAGDGCWYVIAVPVNSNNEDGPHVGCVKRIGAGAACSGDCGTLSQVFYDVGVQAWDQTTGTEAYPGYNRLYWKFTQAGVNPELLKVRILAEDLDNPSGPIYDLTDTYETAHGPRWIDLDAATGSDPWGNQPTDSAVQVQGGVASYIHGVFNKHVMSGGATRTWRYTLAAYDSLDQLMETVAFDYTSEYHHGLPASTLPYLQSVSASNAYPGHNTPICDDPYTNIIQWDVQPSTHPMDDLFVIHLYVDDNGTVSSLIRDLPLRAFTSWYHALEGYVTNWSCTAPQNVLHRYKVELAYADPSKRDPNYSDINGVIDFQWTDYVAGLVWLCDGNVIQGGCSGA